MMAFIPVFFFASEYAQIALHKSASEAGIFLLYFFVGFVIMAQIGGRMLDREGAKRAVVIGCAIAAVGFGFWASKVDGPVLQQPGDLGHRGRGRHGHDARPGQHRRGEPGGNLSYGEATGITQTIRNFGASLGSGGARHDPADHLPLAPDDVAEGDGRSERRRARPTASRSPSRATDRWRPSRTSSRSTSPTRPQAVLYVMCGIMAFAGLVALFGLRRGRQEVARSRTAPCRRPPPEADLRSPEGSLPRFGAAACRNLVAAVPSQSGRSL